MTTSFSEILSNSERALIGTWVKMPTTVSVELLAIAGFDFVVIDMEHAPLSPETVHELIGAARSRAIPALVRVPDHTPSTISRTLDSGADGVLVPHVENEAEAKAAIGAARLPPMGSRGYGPTVRAGDWGADVAGYQLAAQQAFVAPQLESRGAIDEAQSIASLEGIGALFVGPADLSVATGLEPDSAEFRQLVSDAERAANHFGIPVGTAVPADMKAARAAAERYDFVVVGNDASLLRTAGSALIEALQSP